MNKQEALEIFVRSLVSKLSHEYLMRPNKEHGDSYEDRYISNGLQEIAQNLVEDWKVKKTFNWNKEIMIPLIEEYEDEIKKNELERESSCYGASGPIMKAAIIEQEMQNKINRLREKVKGMLT